VEACSAMLRQKEQWCRDANVVSTRSRVVKIDRVSERTTQRVVEQRQCTG